MRFASLLLTGSRKNLRHMQYPRFAIVPPAQAALDIEDTAQIAQHDRVRAAVSDMLALVVGKASGDLAVLEREGAAETAARLALSHFANFQARHLRQ